MQRYGYSQNREVKFLVLCIFVFSLEIIILFLTEIYKLNNEGLHDYGSRYSEIVSVANAYSN